MISIIVAAALNNAIGKNNQLLWHLPNDMKFFKNTTWGMVVIMGRKTFESLGKPLPGRLNIVISRQDGWNAAGISVAKSLEEAIAMAESENFKEIFIIGGGEIYRLAMPLAQCIYLTRVHAQPTGDTFFPEIKEDTWKLKGRLDFQKDEKHAFEYSFEKWGRR